MMSAPPREARGGDQALAARAAARQQLPGVAPGADLQQLPAEDVLHGLGQKLGLGRQE